MLIKKGINFLKQDTEEYTMLSHHVLESMGDWVRVVDYSGTILYANKSMKESLGDDLIGDKCYRIHKKDEPCGFCISKRSIENKEIVQKEEVINGKFFSIKSSPIIDCDGRAIAAVEVFRDVTRERKLELELIERNRKMSKDLLLAKRLQRRILPKKGIYKTLKIDYLYTPSEMLSGDMFDIYYIDENNIGIYICDVVGHGISASMMTMFVRQTMRSIKDDIFTPSDCLTELHNRFITLDLEADKYFTIFYGIYNIQNNHFGYANAGHNCIPIRYNSRGFDLLETKGLPISSIFNRINYKENNIKLDKGDTLLFYTDGITEVKNIEGKEFGVDGVIDIINNQKGNVINSIREKVEKFRWGEQRDDFAVVSVEIIE